MTHNLAVVVMPPTLNAALSLDSARFTLHRFGIAASEKREKIEQK